MTAVTPDPLAIRPELSGDAGHGPLPGPGRGTTALRVGVATVWLSVIVLLPLAAIAWQAAGGGWHAFWLTVTSNAALESFRVTLTISAAVTVLNLIFGLVIAWVLVRDDFPGRRLVDAIIDLPFALPTIVASLVMLALYGNNSPVGLHLQHTAWGVAVALAFVTLPFVVRSVQPVLDELDREVEEAAASLGASPATRLRRIILPTLAPAIAAGGALSFARAMSEYGALVLLSGNLPNRTEVAAVRVFTYIENGDMSSAAVVATMLLVVSFATLLAIDLIQRKVARRG